MEVWTNKNLCRNILLKPVLAETVVWPNFFLMNIFFALKGSKLFIIIFKNALFLVIPKFLGFKKSINMFMGFRIHFILNTGTLEIVKNRFRQKEN